MCDSTRTRASRVVCTQTTRRPQASFSRNAFAQGGPRARQGGRAGCGGGLWGMEELNQDRGMTAPRNNAHVLKRHCQNAAEAGPAACLQSGCSCSVCVCTACPPRPWRGSTNTSHNGPDASPGPLGVSGEGMSVQYLVKGRKRLFHLFHTSERRVRFLLVMKESPLGTGLLSHCGGHVGGQAGPGSFSAPASWKGESLPEKVGSTPMPLGGGLSYVHTKPSDNDSSTYIRMTWLCKKNFVISLVWDTFET